MKCPFPQPSILSISRLYEHNRNSNIIRLCWLKSYKMFLLVHTYSMDRRGYHSWRTVLTPPHHLFLYLTHVVLRSFLLKFHNLLFIRFILTACLGFRFSRASFVVCKWARLHFTRHPRSIFFCCEKCQEAMWIIKTEPDVILFCDI